MFSVTTFGRSTQKVVCMLMSAVIVSATLAFGAYGSQTSLHSDYSVTVTQLQ